MLVDRRQQYWHQMNELAQGLAGNTERLRVKKKTVSNLFRYEGRSKPAGREVDLSAFDQPLYLDTEQQTLEVQGLATYEKIVDFVLPHGFTPVITPELKHITVGGAIVGIGIETNSFRYGFVHDSLLEADVLLPSGDVVTCSATNEYADLFCGLPNSYGTLGYILRATIKLRRAKPYVRLHTERLRDTAELVQMMKQAGEDHRCDYIESLIYSPGKLYMTTSRQVDQAAEVVSIYGSTVFYQEISRPGDLTLTIKDYLFRYDPEWFWAMPHTPLYNFFRKVAPVTLRNSSFFTRYAQKKAALAAKLPFLRMVEDDLEHLIQDWEVPWEHGQALLDFALDNLDLDGKPLLISPVTTPGKATGYPLKPGVMYLNLGSYNFVRKQPGKPPYFSTKIMDEFCFAHDGIKMLYSTTFLDESDFNRLYNGPAHAALKAKYDPRNLLPTLHDKAVKAF
jgi:FAD/FMN-containing dehydrogenase